MDRLDLKIVGKERRQMQLLGQSGHHGFQVQKSIGNMQYQDAILLQSIEVKLQRLLGDQMDWNRIGAERVDYDDPELFIVMPLQLNAGMPELDFTVGASRLRILQVGKKSWILRDALPQRVDLKKRHMLPALSVPRHRSSAEADHRHVRLHPRAGEFRHDVADWPGLVIIRERLVD